MTLISLPRLFRFWLPLQATWLMMSVEGPFLAAVIARLADPKHNLAAYGVAFALAIMVEAPVIMMMSASTALADSRTNYQRLRTFTWLLNVLISVVMVLLLLTPAWPLAANGLMDLTPAVADLAHQALLILLPWPAAIGFRRFYQGLLIRTGATRLVALGTVIRLLAMAASALAAVKWTDLPGASVGAVALTGGVVAEALGSRLMARHAVARVLAEATPEDEAMSYGAIVRFYYPLALTSTISLVVHPLVTFFMGQSRNALESLAVLPVVNSLVFIFRTPGLSFQEAAITMLQRSWDNLPRVRLFALVLGLGASVGLALIALTPLAHLWFHDVSGLDDELTAFAALPLRILVVMPVLSVLLSWQRALLVAGRRTGPITWASVFEVGGILVALTVLVHGTAWVGVTAAALAFVIGRLLGNTYLVRGMLRAAPPQRTRSTT